MSKPLLAPTFLFRFSVPCRYQGAIASVEQVTLGADFTVPQFGQLEGRPQFAELRAAWNARGLAFDLTVRGKRQPLWCQGSRLLESDGLRLWIDTRDAHTIHRATRFCHYFVFLPRGGGKGLEEPVAALVPIHRARENPRFVNPNQLPVRSECHPGGYRLRVFLPAAAITGYDPGEQPRLGFFYAVVDRELGWQTFSIGPEFPVGEDPSLWGTLELIHASD